jgi:hypothetical protein
MGDEGAALAPLPGAAKAEAAAFAIDFNSHVDGIVMAINFWGWACCGDAGRRFTERGVPDGDGCLGVRSAGADDIAG